MTLSVPNNSTFVIGSGHLPAIRATYVVMIGLCRMKVTAFSSMPSASALLKCAIALVRLPNTWYELPTL